MRAWVMGLAAALVVSSGALEQGTLAATRFTDDLTELLRMADAAAEVSVVHTTVKTPGRAGVPLTVVTLKVQRVYKGDLPAGTEIAAEYPGGFDGAHTVVSPGQPQLHTGDRGVLLLARPAGQASTWRVLGGDVGQIVLTRNDAGQDVARRPAGQFEYYVQDRSSLTGYRRVACAALSAELMEELVQTILRTGRPVLEREERAAVPAQPVPAATQAPRMALPAEPDGAAWPMRLIVVLVVTTVAWLASRRAVAVMSRG